MISARRNVDAYNIIGWPLIWILIGWISEFPLCVPSIFFFLRFFIRWSLHFSFLVYLILVESCFFLAPQAITLHHTICLLFTEECLASVGFLTYETLIMCGRRFDIRWVLVPCWRFSLRPTSYLRLVSLHLCPHWLVYLKFYSRLVNNVAILYAEECDALSSSECFTCVVYLTY